MKKSELVKQLQDEIEKYGDCHIKEVVIDELGHWWRRCMSSPTRINKATKEKAKMNASEFAKYCEENPIGELK